MTGEVKSAYEHSHNELVEKLIFSIARASLKSLADASYFEGVILARLEGIKPPFMKKDVVVLRLGFAGIGRDLGTSQVNKETLYTVFRVHYANNDWYLEFCGCNSCGLYSAEQFVLAETNAKDEIREERKPGGVQRSGTG